jgi:hypothetical protein
MFDRQLAELEQRLDNLGRQFVEAGQQWLLQSIRSKESVVGSDTDCLQEEDCKCWV